MKATVTDVINNLLDVPESDREAQVGEFCRTYREIFASTFAVNMFYNSCAVFVPPGININLDRICADAGYIHSAGHSVFIRNLKKARQKDFEASVHTHLSSLPTEGFPVPFVVFAHEDFSEDDKDSRDQINRGIEGTKLFIEKMSMGSNRLAQIIQDMRRQFKGRLDIPEPGSYKSHKFEKSKAMWLICDRSVAPINTVNPGSERYYICYQQQSKNDNAFFYFDENKPAWKSHTTMPHSLTAALINATRPHADGIAICDPFGGTGTTWFEVKRLGLAATVRCSDLSPIMKLLVEDNLKFFLMNRSDLSIIHDQLHTVVEAVKKDGAHDGQQISLELNSESAPYSYAVRLLNDLKVDQPLEDQEFSFSPAFVENLARQHYFTRLVFYVVLRAELRYQGGFKRKATRFSKAFEKSLNELLHQTMQLLGLRHKVDDRAVTNCGSYLTFRGTYSSVIVPSLITELPASFTTALAGEILIEDACDLAPSSVDVIVCDPPYGFNTTEDRNELARLYSRFLDSAILALREHGHLIVCLPAESYTGRDLPYCTYGNLVSNQILVKAHKLRKKIFVPGRSLPHRMLVPPYYWEAERALRRVVLHFRVSG